MQTRFLFVAAFVAAWLAAPAHGVNKCVDRDGRTSYSDQPCAGATKSSQLELPATLPTTASVSPAPGQVPAPAVSANLKQLQLCDMGRSGACFQRDLLDKKCRLGGGDRIDTSRPECRDYRDDLKKFQALRDQCRHGRVAAACFTLACAEGDASACQRLQGSTTSSQDREAVRRQAARESGLPSGPTWYMSQDWFKQGDGRMTASINCSATTSIALIRKPPVLERIYTTVTGDQYFVRLEDAAARACALATKD